MIQRAAGPFAAALDDMGIRCLGMNKCRECRTQRSDNHSGFNVRMTQQFLNCADIGAAFEEMGCK
jgi:hypothetical protein